MRATCSSLAVPDVRASCVFMCIACVYVSLYMLPNIALCYLKYTHIPPRVYSQGSGDGNRGLGVGRFDF